MKKLVVLGSILSVLGLLVVSESWAQRGPAWRGSGGWGPGGAFMKMYDPAKVETVTGEVVTMDLVRPMPGMSQGVHLVLKTEGESLAVHLGPSWYVENQDMKLAPKDKVQVKGARVTIAGKPALIAAEIRKDGEVLVLRDERGFPAWSGTRRR